MTPRHERSGQGQKSDERTGDQQEHGGTHEGWSDGHGPMEVMERLRASKNLGNEN